ncbi:serine hydrolase [Dermacoccus nishinomiyaensis]|nr:serine hydrolase [Dermacoccus nishinomiyaensis]
MPARSPQQSASAIKALHLVAYAEAVSRGRLDPDARVTLRLGSLVLPS